MDVTPDETREGTLAGEGIRPADISINECKNKISKTECITCMNIQEDKKRDRKSVQPKGWPALLSIFPHPVFIL